MRFVLALVLAALIVSDVSAAAKTKSKKKGGKSGGASMNPGNNFKYKSGMTDSKSAMGKEFKSGHFDPKDMATKGT